MSTISESIDVDVPVTTAYNQWTQFESFPEFRHHLRPQRDSARDAILVSATPSAVMAAAIIAS